MHSQTRRIYSFGDKHGISVNIADKSWCTTIFELSFGNFQNSRSSSSKLQISLKKNVIVAWYLPSHQILNFQSSLPFPSRGCVCVKYRTELYIHVGYKVLLRPLSLRPQTIHLEFVIWKPCLQQIDIHTCHFSLPELFRRKICVYILHVSTCNILHLY